MQPEIRIRELPSEWRKVNLGCNQVIIPEWINTDIVYYDGVDLVTDLNNDWPWKDNSLHYIRAFDLVEHLKDSVHTMNEAWRVLAHGGIFEVWVPSTDGRGAFQDPTHVSFWNRNSFLYYSKKHLAGIYPNLIKCDFDIRIFDTNPTPEQIIWTWALCRAIKDASHPKIISDDWFDALSNPDANKRVMPGYKGNYFGTTQVA